MAGLGEKLATLAAMGLGDREGNARLLEETDGNLERATAVLLAQMG